jgi:hypothetical protein
MQCAEYHTREVKGNRGGVVGCDLRKSQQFERCRREAKVEKYGGQRWRGGAAEGRRSEEQRSKTSAPYPSASLLLDSFLGLLGAARRYHLVNDPCHQHEETQHERNP